MRWFSIASAIETILESSNLKKNKYENNTNFCESYLNSTGILKL